MKNNDRTAFSLVLMLLFVSVMVLEQNAYARAGGSRSFGSSGSRSYAAPTRSPSGPATPTQPTSPSSVQQPAGGGFLRSMGGGLLGGLLGGMLFSSLGFGGSGIGLFEIVLFAGIGYFIYSIVMKKRRDEALAYQGSSPQGGSIAERFPSSGTGGQQATNVSVNEGIAYIRRMDPSFSEDRFRDAAMDVFFKIQGAWTHRDLTAADGLLTDEMKTIFQEDIDNLLREKKVNRLENIAVRNVEIVEAWQEAGQDFIKTLFTANLLDYTTDDSTGTVIAGSKTEPVKFEECWTFTRAIGNNPWKLSAISQV